MAGVESGPFVHRLARGALVWVSTVLVEVRSLEDKLSVLPGFSVTRAPAESGFLTEKERRSGFPGRLRAHAAVGSHRERSAGLWLGWQ